MLIEEFQKSCPATEYIRWVEFYRRQNEARNKEALGKTVDQWHMAQLTFYIALLIHVQTNDPKNPKEFDKEIEDFLLNDRLKVITPEEKMTAEEEAQTEEEQKEAERNKAKTDERVVLAAFGLSPEDLEEFEPGVPVRLTNFKTQKPPGFAKKE